MYYAEMANKPDIIELIMQSITIDEEEIQKMMNEEDQEGNEEDEEVEEEKATSCH